MAPTYGGKQLAGGAKVKSGRPMRSLMGQANYRLEEAEKERGPRGRRYYGPDVAEKRAEAWEDSAIRKRTQAEKTAPHVAAAFAHKPVEG